MFVLWVTPIVLTAQNQAPGGDEGAFGYANTISLANSAYSSLNGQVLGSGNDSGRVPDERTTWQLESHSPAHAMSSIRSSRLRGDGSDHDDGLKATDSRFLHAWFDQY